MRKFIATIGYAPIPTHTMSALEVGPLNTKPQLKKYVEARSGREGGGILRDVVFDEEGDAKAFIKGFMVPQGMLWFKRVAREKLPGAPESEISYESGLRP